MNTKEAKGRCTVRKLCEVAQTKESLGRNNKSLYPNLGKFSTPVEVLTRILRGKSAGEGEYMEL